MAGGQHVVSLVAAFTSLTCAVRYKGECRGKNLDGRAAAQAAVDEAHQAGGQISAFFCESILSCGGQVVLPSGYLQEVYDVMHQAGAVCIADEVTGHVAYA